MDGSKMFVALYYRIKYIKIIRSRIKGVYRNIFLHTHLDFKWEERDTEEVKIQSNHSMDWSEVSIALYHRMKYIEIICSRIKRVYQNIIFRKSLCLRHPNYFSFTVSINLVLKLLIIFNFFHYRMLGYSALIHLLLQMTFKRRKRKKIFVDFFSFNVIYLILIFE